MCDTFVVVSPERTWFAKNSDRDANEGQSLQWVPAMDHAADAVVRVTHGAVLPQARRTAAILISRPFWLWGAEMGVNAHGVAIGNEAVFTAVRPEEGTLLGMDLVRLALERATTAEEAVHVLRTLLAEHGQGGRAGLEDPTFRYHNAFLVADAQGAWVVDTCNRDVAVERVEQGVRSISNGLSVASDFRPDRLRTAVAGAETRRACTAAGAAAARSLGDVMDVLRDHGPGPGPAYRWLNGTLSVPAMHGGGLVASSVTTASWVSELRADGAAHWATACAAPDIALFKPVAVHDPVDLGPFPTDRHDGSRFWRQERLHRAWLRDPARLGERFLPELRATQERWLASPPSSHEAFAEEDALLPRWIEAVSEAGSDVRPWYARRFWQRRERWASEGGSGALAPRPHSGH